MILKPKFGAKRRNCKHRKCKSNEMDWKSRKICLQFAKSGPSEVRAEEEIGFRRVNPLIGGVHPQVVVCRTGNSSSRRWSSFTSSRRYKYL